MWRRGHGLAWPQRFPRGGAAPRELAAEWSGHIRTSVGSKPIRAGADGICRFRRSRLEGLRSRDNKTACSARPLRPRPFAPLEELPMSDTVKVGFVPLSQAVSGTLVVFCDDALKMGKAATKALGGAAATVKRAAAAARFKGKNGATLDILAPDGLKADRLLVVGTGKAAELKETDLLKFGGVLAGRVGSSGNPVTVIAELPSGEMTAAQAAAGGSGVLLRAYKLHRYKTKKKDDDDKPVAIAVSLAVGDVAAAKKAFGADNYVVEGVVLARELVNEPPNVLFPEEFARRAAALKKLGVAIEILDDKAMDKLGMGALLGVAQGSVRPARMVVMRWNGGKKGDAPIA